ncbi:glutamate--cysteine ligase [Zafaria sp. Z1313]|uniref:glutamate--cysteine ligase n=1 Tax=unclassified Zafaria TaxID=2828765 RepID=UPI002E77ADD5|nr:glutamate--cysteine ligase [Zafaria sp. J156]MEE1619857.1 glutamate--cysteine ligase [Zafaria sp. J156]
MGAEVNAKTYTREQRTRYRERLMDNLETFEAFLATGTFAGTGTIGLELELNLANDDFTPAMRNAEVLEQIADEAFQTEIGAFNIELNHPALAIAGRGLRDLEESLRQQLNRADERAENVGADLLMVGILPTLRQELVKDTQWISAGKRYAALNTSVLQARGEDVLIDIAGQERLRFYAANIAPEAACTSVQLHLQVSPSEFAPVWNAAQVIAAPQVALAANSPVFMEKVLWHESRIEVFKQSIDTRPPEMKNQGVRPRVWFGERWITSIFDLFEENVRYFPALLPQLSRRVSQETTGGAPQLHELRLHNGTVYRWNRPIYDPGEDLPNLRLENRLLPGGPTVVDTVANAAFFFGLVRKLRTADRPLWSRMAFTTASDNFHECARRGLDAHVYWPGIGDIPVSELIVRHLLPMAAEGLDDLGVDRPVAQRYLDVLRERARSEQNGAAWQIKALAQLEGHGLDRRRALQELTRLYWEHMHHSGPVHEWPLPDDH